MPKHRCLLCAQNHLNKDLVDFSHCTHFCHLLPSKLALQKRLLLTKYYSLAAEEFLKLEILFSSCFIHRRDWNRNGMGSSPRTPSPLFATTLRVIVPRGAQLSGISLSFSKGFFPGKKGAYISFSVIYLLFGRIRIPWHPGFISMVSTLRSGRRLFFFSFLLSNLNFERS